MVFTKDKIFKRGYFSVFNYTIVLFLGAYTGNRNIKVCVGRVPTNLD